MFRKHQNDRAIGRIRGRGKLHAWRTVQRIISETMIYYQPSCIAEIQYTNSPKLSQWLPAPNDT